MQTNPAEDEFSFEAANTLLRIGGVILLLFLLFIMSRVNTSVFPYGSDTMKKFVNASFSGRAK